MTCDEKLQRALAEPWEFVGEPLVLCQLLRAECLRLRSEEQHLLDEIAYLKNAIQETEKQASRAVDEAKYDAEAELQRGIRSREDGWG